MAIVVEEAELLGILVEAYQSGWRGSLELKDSVANELLEKIRALSHKPIEWWSHSPESSVQMLDPIYVATHTLQNFET